MAPSDKRVTLAPEQDAESARLDEAYSLPLQRSEEVILVVEPRSIPDSRLDEAYNLPRDSQPREQQEAASKLRRRSRLDDAYNLARDSESRKQLDPFRFEGKYDEINKAKARRAASSPEAVDEPSAHHHYDYSARLDRAYDLRKPLTKREDYSDRLDLAYDPEYHTKSSLLTRHDDSHMFPLPGAAENIVSRSLPATKYNPGQGSKNPNSINNNAYFALFAILGVGMVLTSIWFFFWAKNGGFVWRKGDWDDYKSTVLRRKGPDGKTLSNATKTTMLGQKSIAGTFDLEKQEMREVRDFVDDRRKRTRKSHGAAVREPSDEDVRAYRQEKPARVGGLNRGHDGSHWNSAGTSRSDLMSEASDRPLYPDANLSPPKKKGFAEHRRERKQEKKQIKQAQKTKDAIRNAGGADFISKPSRARRHSFTTVDDSVVGTSERHSSSNGNTHDSYYAAYRPQPNRYQSPHRQSNRTSHPAPPPRMPKHPGSFDAYSEAGESETGTKIYTHHIPGVSRTGRDGFRRGGRRDSFSS